VSVYLLRHAKAGNRSAWSEPDWLRPLTEAGQLQARKLLTTFDDARFGRIFASPYVRCMETVVPLASHHCLPVEPVDALTEGAPVDAALGLVEKLAARGVVLCSHGDIIPALLEQFATRGTDLGPQPRCEKGSVWVLEGDVAATPSARYIPPP
jgi:8-oxo-dGTP diphosphatase